ncbi:MAG: hypothetical protein WAT93_03200 [Pontixanthobacter sp.]
MTTYLHHTAAALVAATLLIAGSAQAAPLTFDCDVPANSVSSVSNLAQTVPAIGGTITAKKFREGQLSPSAGVQIEAPDGKSIAGFVLRLSASDPAVLEIMLVSNNNGKQENFQAGTISATGPIAFQLFVDDQGAINIVLNDQSWSAPFMRLIGGKEKAFCSTGQFQFSDLRFSD